MPLAIGARLGRYEIVAPLGAGGMGEVYRARDPRLEREVAIKVIPAALAGDSDRLARFEQEARAAGALQDPGICTILDTGTHDGAPFVVMELLEGETLRELLGRGPLPWRKAVEYTITIARALAAAHEKGIIHRDLKPENLFLTRDGRTKVLDFGLAKLVHPDGMAMSGLDTMSVAMTESGVILGTAGYMAPEQVRGQSTDARTDLFALGAVLYEMLTGSRAFQGASFIETGNAILNHEPELDSSSGREIPPALRRTVARCISKSAEQRFRSAADLAFHIEALLGSDAGASLSAASMPRRLAPGPVGLLLSALALIAVLAGGALLGRRMGAASESRSVHFPLPPPAGGKFAFGLEEAKSFAVSPDGSTIAFVASDSSGARSAWLRPLGESAAKRLSGTEGARSLFWSPDGRSLGFFASRALKRLDLGSSGVVNVCELPANVLCSGSWGSKGTILFAGVQEGIVYRVPAAGGEPSVVVETRGVDGETGCAWPEFLPDGHRFLYLSRRLDHADSLLIGDLDGVSHPLMAISSRAEFADPQTLLYVIDGTLVSRPFDVGNGRVTGRPVPVAQGISCFSTTGGAIFSASGSGVIAFQRAGDSSRLAWFNGRGEEIGRVGADADYLGGLDLTADGRRLLCSRRRPGRGTWDIWLIDVSRGSESRVTTGSNVTEVLPQWLPGEESFAYSSASGASPQLFRRDLTSGESTPLLPPGGFQIAIDVSPDGLSLLYQEVGHKGAVNLWVYPLAGGESRRLTSGVSSERGVQFSPDGRHVALFADEGERFELGIVPFARPGQRVRVSTHGALGGQWSRDGESLFYLTPDGYMMEAPVRLQPGVWVGAPRELFRLRGRLWEDFLIAPDGRFLALVPEVVQAEEPVDVIVGWRPEAALR